MKNEIRFTLLLVIIMSGQAFNAFGQEELFENKKLNGWRTMAGYSFFGGGDIDGLTVMNEYNRCLNKHLRVAPNFKFSSASRLQKSKAGLNNLEDNFLFMQANIVELGLMGYYEYLNPNNTGLELGLGFFYRNLQHTIITGPYALYESNELNLGFSSAGQYSENTVGFNVSLGIIIAVNDLIGLNFNGLVQSDTGDNAGYGILAGLTIRF